MKVNICLVLLLASRAVSQTIGPNIVEDPEDEEFEREIQPAVPAPVNVSDRSQPVLPPAVPPAIRYYPSQQIYGEVMIRGGSNIRGILFFGNSWNGVYINGIVCGLRPGNHGFHIHQYGATASGGCETAGPHFSLHYYAHAGPMDKYRHAGDLGNLQANHQGIAYVQQFNGAVTLSSANNTILGRAVVIHDRPDDLGVGGKESNVTGNAGKAIACGIIGLRKEKPRFPLPCPL